MPGTIHKDKLVDHLDRIESDRKKLFAELDDLSQEKLHFRRSPDKWTILQILDHLMTSEKLSLVYIKRKTSSGNSIERSGFLSRFRIFTLKLAFFLPFKYKAPKISDSTGKNPNYKELKMEWQGVRSEMKELIRKLDENTLKGQIFKHPILGMLNMKQTLQFFDIHFNHHKKQIENRIELTLHDLKN
ncbi:DinB family protein [Rhodohalobacter sulfatireducens]|uniref:DinB family protein n=1 Tax=Rhodohalobacter sulfatireducens TaxID=2911366 RepID=A0ABS9KCF2_9BACT|nr:DinB family protein [Rhodohalobacter sulfatireducens]MCG2588534.1 DinB family protein [Rhodohalobacter sulfatireducens]